MTLLFDVEFHHGELVPSPLNLGSMPLIALDTSLAHGALLAETTVQQAGSAPPNMSFPEFKVIYMYIYMYIYAYICVYICIYI